MYHLPVGLLIIVGNALKSAQINKEKSKWETRPFWNDGGNVFDSQECNGLEQGLQMNII